MPFFDEMPEFCDIMEQNDLAYFRRLPR